MRKKVVPLSKVDNPYMNLAEIMKNSKGTETVPFFIGKVISAEPLLVQAGNIQLERDDMLINEFLLKNHKRKVHIKSKNMDADLDSKKDFKVSNIDMYESEIETEDDFKAGEQVILLMSIDQQQFVLLCKVM